MTKKQALLRDLKDQVDHLETELAELQRRSDRLTNIRLATFLLGVAASAATLLSFGVWAWLAVTLPALLPFAVAVTSHRRIEERIEGNRILLNLKRGYVARMTLDWQNIPATLSDPPPSGHPFAGDLDIVGDRSLHQLMDTAVSREGSQRLRTWLLDTEPDQCRIVERQAEIQELLPLTSFRDELIVSAKRVPSQDTEKWPGERMLEWLEDQRNVHSLAPVLLVLGPLALANIILGLLNAIGLLPPWWIVTWSIYAFLSLIQLRKIGDPFREAFFLRDSLESLSYVFNFLETYQYEKGTRLHTLCLPLLSEGKRPSQQLAQVQRVVAAVALKKNFILWFWLNAIAPWDIYFANRLNQSKLELAERLPIWLDVWFELEALSSLANFAYLNPETTFPEIITEDDANEPRLLVAKCIGHPLITFESRVCNDFSVETPGSIFIVTGSNMAGKSTFLRTIGINLALAYAGGPVVAKQLRIALLRLFTAVKVSDSVVDGFSYFYAEVQRLKTLLNANKMEQSYPLFFLIDEIFRGTNNRERLIGSRAYVRALASGSGAGVIATHDLELIKLEEELPGIFNYHFRDAVQDRRMVFDYKLHPGPCPTTNALKIMHLAGLPVDDVV